MSACTLVLNSSFTAIHVIDWQKAVSLLFQGHAQVVDEDYRTFDFKDWAELSQMMQDSPNGFVNSPTIKLAIPSMIRLTKYDRLPQRTVRFTRKNIFEHYGYRCAYCGKKFKPKELNFDHVVPRSQGGKTNWSNIVASCYSCNTHKANRTPAEAGMRMFYQPSQPKWHGGGIVVSASLPLKVKQTWQQILNRAYWHAELDQD